MSSLPGQWPASDWPPLFEQSPVGTHSPVSPLLTLQASGVLGPSGTSDFSGECVQHCFTINNTLVHFSSKNKPEYLYLLDNVQPLTGHHSVSMHQLACIHHSAHSLLYILHRYQRLQRKMCNTAHLLAMSLLISTPVTYLDVVSPRAMPRLWAATITSTCAGRDTGTA